MNTLQAAFSKWAKECANSISLYKPQHLHVESKFFGKRKQLNIISASLEAFAAVAKTIDNYDKTSPILMVPIKPIQKLDTRSIDFQLTSWDQLLDLLDLEPPSIYLVSPNSASILTLMEEYRKPLALPAGLPRIGGWYSAYYRIHRDWEEVQQNGEFSREVILTASGSKWIQPWMQDQLQQYRGY